MSPEVVNALCVSVSAVSGACLIGFLAWSHGKSIEHAQREADLDLLVYDIAVELRGYYGTGAMSLRKLARGIAVRSLAAGRTHAETRRIAWRVKRSLISSDLLLEDSQTLRIFWKLKGTGVHTVLSAPYKLRNWLLLVAES
jgi:hypothetical protein